MICMIIIFPLLRRKTLLYMIITSFIFQQLYYTHISCSSVFYSLVITVETFIKSIDEMCSPYHAQGVEYVTKPKTPLHQVLTYMYILTLVVVALGVSWKIIMLLQLFKKRQVISQEKQIYYYSLSIAAGFFFLITSLSTLSASLNITRIYHLAAFVLALNFVDGYKFIAKKIKLAGRESLWACFLIIFLLFFPRNRSPGPQVVSQDL